jgi:hypothetical protein
MLFGHRYQRHFSTSPKHTRIEFLDHAFLEENLPPGLSPSPISDTTVQLAYSPFIIGATLI